MITIAAYLFAKREVILNSWFTRVTEDPASITAVTLTRDEFNDQIPLILDILDQRLRHQKPKLNALTIASEHGMHRWHKGYGLTELLQEVAHLHTLITHELEIYGSIYADTELSVLSNAHRLVNEIMHEAIQGSAAQYNDLQRQDASQRATNLQQALQALDELTRQRGEVLRNTSHDLRSHFSLLSGAAWMLDQPGTEREQKQWRDMWQRNLDSAATLLMKLMDFARLEAGQETLQIESFNAGDLLRQIAGSIQPSAEQRRLSFEWTGPESLVVDGDPIKVQRIVQNLLTNALNHTQQGWITLSWSREDNFRWIVSVQDSGPGLPPNIAGEVGQALVPTVDSTSIFRDSNPIQPAPDPEKAIPVNPSQPKGEGIGLLIVKKLCELLRADLDIETRPEVGTLFRVRFPMHYTKHD
ncbi:sensor histidine kinase [Spirosoma validum]|uniref:histidine kinase n=1 Tax=Spirosoma validum TaxID=2771355 RepID=A0A927B0N1_9BACT|nr:HAMP domain-containing sensor histidine kinase [Spirosoma validum]MBD2753364.1 HAMP domain-containing histidine kinase [Spirosoma validum]